MGGMQFSVRIDQATSTFGEWILGVVNKNN
jgi:hypothetical protein